MSREWERQGLTPRQKAKLFYESLIVVEEYDGKGGWASDIDFIEELFEEIERMEK